MLLDEQFRYVASGSGADQVKAANAGSVYPHQFSGLPIPKSGYLYVYVSNESQGVDVYFDNLQVTHIHGPLLEETHYYPFGLTMQGISSKAAGGVQNRLKFGGKEEQRGEFADGSGLEALDFGARLLDPQLGVWHNVDPLSEISRRWSPYAYCADNPLRFIDPDGMAYMGYGHDNMDQVVADGDATRLQGPDLTISKGSQNGGTQNSQTQNDDGGGDKDKKRSKPNPDHSYHPTPKNLPAFPDAKRAPSKGPVMRPRWKLPDGTIFEWDRQEGHLEKYDRKGKPHQGAYDHETGNRIKDPVPGRWVTPFNQTAINPNPVAIPSNDNVNSAVKTGTLALAGYVLLKIGEVALTLATDGAAAPLLLSH